MCFVSDIAPFCTESGQQAEKNPSFPRPALPETRSCRHRVLPLAVLEMANSLIVLQQERRALERKMSEMEEEMKVWRFLFPLCLALLQMPPGFASPPDFTTCLLPQERRKYGKKPGMAEPFSSYISPLSSSSSRHKGCLVQR